MEDFLKLESFLNTNGVYIIHNKNRPCEYYSKRYDIITDGKIECSGEVIKLSNHTVVCNILENVIYMTSENLNDIINKKLIISICNKFNLKSKKILKEISIK